MNSCPAERSLFGVSLPGNYYLMDLWLREGEFYSVTLKSVLRPSALLGPTQSLKSPGSTPLVMS